MGILDEIAQSAAARRAAENDNRGNRDASASIIAATQQIALARWEREILPAIRTTVGKLNVAVGGRATGDYLEWHSEHCSQIVRSQIAIGEQMSLTLKYHRRGKCDHVIKCALVASNGPDTVVLVITHGEHRVVALVVDENFRTGPIEHFLMRILRDIECDTA